MSTVLSPTLSAATTGRVLRQLRHDHRTVAMLVTRNMTTNGKIPSMVSPTRSKRLGCPGKVGTSFHSR